MFLTFKMAMPIADTMRFEECFEPELRLDAAAKAELIACGVAAWLLVDGAVAGEAYGVPPDSAALIEGEAIADCEGSPDSIYCYSTAVLPEFRGKRLASLLKAFWLGRVSERGFRSVVGHSTSPAMRKINRSFGAVEKAHHAGWYGTEREAWFYEIELDDRSAVQRGADDCAIGAVEFMARWHGRLSPGYRVLAEAGGVSPEGTSHRGVCRMLRACGFDFKEATGLAGLPAIVNYQWDGDGHYGVAIRRSDDRLRIYNPATGRIDVHSEADFDKLFFSRRYEPPRWSVSVRSGG